MDNINGKLSSTLKSSQVKYFEENIYIEGYGYLKYSFSNSFEEIKKSILRRTGKYNLNFINGLEWYLNQNLSDNVKNLMNKYNINYSMTMYNKGINRVIIINKRIGSEWRVAIFDEAIHKYSSYIIPFIPIFIFLILIIWYRGYNSNNVFSSERTFGVKQSNYTTSNIISTTNGSIYKDIEKTLEIVGQQLRRKIDVNKDGKTNCIDAAVLFYKYFPDKESVCIELNYNSSKNFNHLFNCVKINEVWKAIEPQAYWNGRKPYLMYEYWGNKYDRQYNKDVTSMYLKYCM